MRHGNKVNPLGRKAAHRHALLRNLAIAIIEHKRISTTLPKARELRKFIEPLVTKAKDDTTHNRRVTFSYLQNKEAIKELFGSVKEKVGDRPGGYVRIIKTGFRKSDGAEMAMIEFVDFNDVYTSSSSSKSGSASKRRGRRGGKVKASEEVAATPVAETSSTDVAEDAVVEENSESKD